MYRHVATLLAIFLVTRTAHGNDLLEFYHLALEHDATLQTAIAQRDAAIEVRPQAISQLLPQLLATGSGTRERVDTETGTSANGQQSAGCPQSTDGAQHCTGMTHGYAVTLTQTLWSFETFNRLKEANRQAASAEATLMAAQQSLQLRVAQAYFGILEATDQYATSVNQRDAFKVLLDQATARLQTGVGARSDVEQAQAFYDATAQGVIDARNALDDANLAMTEIVGAHSARIASLRDNIPLSTPEPASADSWVEIAQNDNPVLRAARLNIEAADSEISAQRGKGLPTLALTASSTRILQGIVLGGNQTLDTIGVSVQWPLFQGGAVASGIRQSRALYRQALAGYQTDAHDIEKQVRAAYRGVVTGIQRVAVANQAVVSGRASVTASKHNVEFGTGTQFDLLNSQNNYSAALRAYNQTRYDYLTNWLALKQQAGRLSDDDLATLDRFLVTDRQE
jgi:outer membrane protein